MTNTLPAAKPSQAPVKLVTQTPIGNAVEITLKRWFQTKEFWVNLAAWISTIGPISLDMIGTIGLEAKTLFIWTMGIHTANFFAQQYLRNTSTSLIVNGKMLRDENAGNDADANQANNPGQ